jgi:uncharacterized protein YbbC (DUF1343 family)
MATTTAAVTLTSDLLSDNMSVSTSTTCMKAGTTADGLDQMESGYVEIATGTNFDLLNADNALNKDKGNKVYICNDSTDETYYVIVTIDATVVGRLYAGDWMFIPWGAEDATADIEIQAYTGTNKISYAWFHEGKTLTSA